MHAVKHIQITACEGPTLSESLYKNKKFTAYKEVDQIIALLAPRDENMLGYYKCFVTITFDDNTTYEAKLELTWHHRCRAAILLPHVISHCETMSGRIVPPNFTFEPERWEVYLNEIEESTPGMRAQYSKMLDEYFT
jgi:hypothetical protein